MKKLFFLCAFLMALVSLSAQESSKREAFSNLGISLNGSTSGVGFTLSTPLAKHFVLRAGYQFSYLSYGYTYKDFDPVVVAGRSVEVPDLDIEGKLNVGAAHAMIDYVPFKKGKGKFFITAGLFMGQSDLVTLDGQFDMNHPNIKEIQQAGLLKEIQLELGDDMVCVGPDGNMAAAIKVKGVRPYIGLGVGRAIPKHRFVFRAEIGAIFHGKPELVSANLIPNANGKGEINDFTNTLSKVVAYPHISLQLTYKLFKD
ncbi:MAG: hypothetical protein IIU59_07800 [Alistipes sp.]|nr:hypothetical protein [Alistipes sp.]